MTSKEARFSFKKGEKLIERLVKTKVKETAHKIDRNIFPIITIFPFLF
tara:strand:+ start:529 stop:672 length:144 start_codon:yes stop_codon:yes gene_type:complete